MSAPTVDPLASLRDYRIPDPVTWWPPAPGWWVLAFLVVLLVTAVTVWLWRRYQRRAAARLALAQLADLRRRLVSEDDAHALASGISQLLRRFALIRFKRGEVAGLTGAAWLGFLDANGGGGSFGGELGRALVEAPYRRSAEFDTQALLDLAADWVKRNAELKS